MMPRPQGVCIRRADGALIPCELSHVGPDSDGCDWWEIATIIEPGDSLLVDEWPANTGLMGPSAGWIPAPPYVVAGMAPEKLTDTDLRRLHDDLARLDPSPCDQVVCTLVALAARAAIAMAKLAAFIARAGHR